MHRKLRLWLLPYFLCWSTYVNAEIYVLGHPQIGITVLTVEQVRDIFLSKLKVLPNGVVVIPVDQTPDNPIRQLFYEKVVKMTTRELGAYWSKRAFMEEKGRPLSISGDAAIIQWVNKHIGAIGYVGVPPNNSGVQVLLVIP